MKPNLLESCSGWIKRGVVHYFFNKDAVIQIKVVYSATGLG